MTQEFQTVADLPSTHACLLAPAENGDCDKLPSEDCIAELETSTSDDIIDLLKELEVEPVNYDVAPVILQHKYQLVCPSVKRARKLA